MRSESIIITKVNPDSDFYHSKISESLLTNLKPLPLFLFGALSVNLTIWAASALTLSGGISFGLEQWLQLWP
jgi:hypothetical protein